MASITNLLFGNLIAYNAGHGIRVESPSTANEFKKNLILANGGLGIDLADERDDVTAVTYRSEPSGPNTYRPNNLVPFPTLRVGELFTGYDPSGAAVAMTRIRGVYHARNDRAIRIDVYANVGSDLNERPTTDPDAFLRSTDPTAYGEGQFYVGSVTLAPLPTNWTASERTFALEFQTPGLPGLGDFANFFYTATATEFVPDTTQADGSFTQTSEFSRAVRTVDVTADSDSDGITDLVEDNNPYLQMFSRMPEFTALPNAVTGEYIVLQVSGGHTLTNVESLPSDGIHAALPNGAYLPIGLISFDIKGLTPGEAVDVTVYLPNGVSLVNGPHPNNFPFVPYYKFGKHRFNVRDGGYAELRLAYPFREYYNFTRVPIPSNHFGEKNFGPYDDEYRGAEYFDAENLPWHPVLPWSPKSLAGYKLHLVDGEHGDDDLTRDGVIHDPGGPIVLNVAETVGLTLDNTSIAKNDTATLSGSFTGLATPGPYRVEIDWDGDGGFDETISLQQEATSFVASHQYQDDGPLPGNGSPYDDYNVIVRLADGISFPVVASTTLRVLNVAPTADAGADQTVAEGSPVTLHGRFSDPSPLDSHMFNWHVIASNGQPVGDGTGADFTFTPQHQGVYTVTYTVTDDDGGSRSDTAVVTAVHRAAPPTVQRVVINKGGTQRSSVKGITVHFSEIVAIQAGAFTLRRNDGKLLPMIVRTFVQNNVPVRRSTSPQTPRNFRATGRLAGPAVVARAPGRPVPARHTVTVLTFAGKGIAGRSLPNRRYTLTINGNRVHDRGGLKLDGNGDGVPGDNAITQLFPPPRRS